MDIGDMSSVIALLRQALGAFKDAQSALPDSQEAKGALRKIEDAEEKLKTAEAQAAQELGYHLCRAHWPPEIKLQGRDGTFRCPKCDGIDFGPEGGDPQLSESELAILRFLFQVNKPVEPERIASQLGVEVGRAEYWLDRLSDFKYITKHLNYVYGPSFSIRRQGREYLIEGEHV